MSELDVGAPDDLDGFNNVVGIFLEPLLERGGDGHHGSRAEGIPRVNSHGVHVFDETHGDAPVFGVSYHLEFQFLPPEHRFLYENLADEAGGDAPPGDGSQLLDIVNQSAAGAPEGISGSDDHGIPQSRGDGLRFLDAVSGLAPGHFDPQAVHGLLEGDAVLTPLDGFRLDPDDTHAVFIEYPGAGKFGAEVESRLPSQVG